MDYFWLFLVVLVVAVPVVAWWGLKLCGFNPDKNILEEGRNIPFLKDVVHEIPTLTDCVPAQEVVHKDRAYWIYVYCVGLGLRVDWREEKREGVGKDDRTTFSEKGDRTTFSEMCLLGVCALISLLSDIFTRRVGGVATTQEKSFNYPCPHHCGQWLRLSDFLMEVPPSALSKPGAKEFSFRHSCGRGGYLSVFNVKDTELIRRTLAKRRVSH